MIKIHATCRIEKATKRPAIFFYGEFRDTFNRVNRYLSCYTREEGHSDACNEYYRTRTRSAKTEEERCACLWLVAQYAQIVGRYDSEQLVIRARLPRAVS